MEVPAVVVVLIEEGSKVVRAVMGDWTMTTRLCVIIIVVAATTCITGLLLR